MAEISISGGTDGRWTVYGPGLVVTDLTREAAETFAESYRRLAVA